MEEIKISVQKRSFGEWYYVSARSKNTGKGVSVFSSDILKGINEVITLVTK